MRVSRIIFGIIGLMLVVGVFITPAAHADTLSAMHTFGVQLPRTEKPAPDFTLRTLSGKPVTLHALRGKFILLHFWATWCVPCREEMPKLHTLAQTFAGQPLQIVCINVDRGNRDGVQQFIDRVTPGFHTLLDPSGEVRRAYAIRILPTTYLINPQGHIIGRIMGERDWSSPAARAMLTPMIETHIKENHHATTHP